MSIILGDREKNILFSIKNVMPMFRGIRPTNPEEIATCDRLVSKEILTKKGGDYLLTDYGGSVLNGTCHNWTNATIEQKVEIIANYVATTDELLEICEWGPMMINRVIQGDIPMDKRDRAMQILDRWNRTLGVNVLPTEMKPSPQKSGLEELFEGVVRFLSTF